MERLGVCGDSAVGWLFGEAVWLCGEAWDLEREGRARRVDLESGERIRDLRAIGEWGRLASSKTLIRLSSASR